MFFSSSSYRRWDPDFFEKSRDPVSRAGFDPFRASMSHLVNVGRGGPDCSVRSRGSNVRDVGHSGPRGRVPHFGHRHVGGSLTFHFPPSSTTPTEGSSGVIPLPSTTVGVPTGYSEPKGILVQSSRSVTTRGGRRVRTPVRSDEGEGVETVESVQSLSTVGLPRPLKRYRYH